MVEWEGNKVGFVGLIESEWLATLATIEEEEVEYVDYVQRARELSGELRAAGADVVIAITHMREPNDNRLADECPEIDLILGGHDHDYYCSPRGPHKTHVVNSGTDFRDLTKLVCRVLPKKADAAAAAPRRLVVESTERVVVDSSVPADAETAAIVEAMGSQVMKQMDVVIGATDVPLDARFSVIRTQESNVGNFIADIMRESTSTDVALVNAGTIRSDTIHPAGQLRLRDLVAMLPMPDELAVLRVSGDQLLSVLENSVSMYPKLEGRFSQVSGVRFAFDPTRPPGKRVLGDSVVVCGRELDNSRCYTLCVKEYISGGKDGYTVLKDCEKLTDGESWPVLPQMVRNHLTKIAELNGQLGGACESGDRHLRRRASKMQIDASRLQTDHRKMARGVCKAGANLLTGGYGISPAIEGRVVCTEGGVVAAHR